MSKHIKLTTPVNVPPQKSKIQCDSKILTLGSCFSDNIGNLLSRHHFDALVNPFGTIFNPASIAKVMRMMLNNTIVKEDDLGNEGNRYFHYDFHSSFDGSSPEKVMNKINESISAVKANIQDTDFLILTFGTSIVYKLKTEEQIVSNCHKVPNHKFEKEYLSVDFMQKEIEELVDELRLVNPYIKIILTVSPVRHTKEGLIENNLSKSRLVDLCHQIISVRNDISYFPSFEIIMDELRDYRYYKSDLIHANDLAIDIIWTYFQETYFDQNAIKKVEDIGGLLLARNHIPFDPLSSDHQKFKINQLKKIERLSKEYPEIDFEKMVSYFKKKNL